MTDSPYTIRNYQPADFDNYVFLCQEAERLEPFGRPVSSQAIAERLGRPNYSPEQDLFVVTRARSIIGYMDVTWELDIGRVILYGWLHPEHRRKGLATKLLGYAMHRAGEAGARIAHVNIREDNAVAKIALSKLGFKYVRRFLELRLDLTKLGWQDMNHAAQRCRHLRHGEEDKLTQIQNRSFAGHWGYNPNTVATTTYRINLGHRYPEDVVLACEADKVIGYCWTETIGEGEGRIYMLGTDPDYRGKGIGRRLLLAGLAYLRSKGTRIVWLTVDSENKMACALYWSAGFELRTSYLWYEKTITQDAGAI